MRRAIFIAFPAGRAHQLQRAPAQALGAVNLARIRAADHKLAMQWFARLAQNSAAALRLTRSDAETLLAACDAVFAAFDDSYVDTAELAIAVERFRTFRTLVHLACSHPPRRRVRSEQAA